MKFSSYFWENILNQICKHQDVSVDNIKWGGHGRNHSSSPCVWYPVTG